MAFSVSLAACKYVCFRLTRKAISESFKEVILNEVKEKKLEFRLNRLAYQIFCSLSKADLH